MPVVHSPSSERRAAEGAEPELRVDGAAARTAPPVLRQEQGRLPWLSAKGPRREKAALAAEVGRVLPGPPPDGDEEELEHLLRLHQVRRAAAPQAPRRRLLEHPPGALLRAADEEEEHLSRLLVPGPANSPSLAIGVPMLRSLDFAVRSVRISSRRLGVL